MHMNLLHGYCRAIMEKTMIIIEATHLNQFMFQITYMDPTNKLIPKRFGVTLAMK